MRTGDPRLSPREAIAPTREGWLEKEVEAAFLATGFAARPELGWIDWIRTWRRSLALGRPHEDDAARTKARERSSGIKDHILEEAVDLPAEGLRACKGAGQRRDAFGHIDIGQNDRVDAETIGLAEQARNAVHMVAVEVRQEEQVERAVGAFREKNPRLRGHLPLRLRTAIIDIAYVPAAKGFNPVVEDAVQRIGDIEHFQGAGVQAALPDRHLAPVVKKGRRTSRRRADEDFFNAHAILLASVSHHEQSAARFRKKQIAPDRYQIPRECG